VNLAETRTPLEIAICGKQTHYFAFLLDVRVCVSVLEGDFVFEPVLDDELVFVAVFDAVLDAVGVRDPVIEFVAVRDVVVAADWVRDGDPIVRVADTVGVGVTAAVTEAAAETLAAAERDGDDVIDGVTVRAFE